MSAKKYSIDEFMRVSTIGAFSVSKDSSLLFYSSDDSGNYDVYSVCLETGLKKRETAFGENAMVCHAFENGSFLFLMDEGGNELHHLYINREGKTEDLTPFEGSKSGFFMSVSDRLYFFSNRLDKSRFDLYCLDESTFESSLIFENKGLYDLGQVSDDGRFISLSKQNTANDSDMLVFDTISNEYIHLTEHQGESHFVPVFFSKDSKELFYLSDCEGEFMELYAIDIFTKKSRKLLSFEWDIISVKRSEDGRYASLILNRDAFAELRVFGLYSGKTIGKEMVSRGVIYQHAFATDSKSIFLLADSAIAPADVFKLSLEDGTLEPLTDSISSAPDKDDLVMPVIRRFPSYDGMEIPGILYLPHEASPGNRVPALIWVHGGPGGQSLPRYNPELQFLVNHGFAIYAVNNRGSSGYGKSFFKAADHKHGEVDLDDCVEAAVFLKTFDEIDGERIGIIGGSYGGFMVLAALAFRPTVFTVGVDIFGVSNWLRTLKEIPSWWSAIRELLYRKIGDPFQEEEYLTSISPLFHASKIKKPLLVLQGANDPRVLKVESDEIVQRTRENGIDTEYVVFEDEGHGFTRKVNRITAANAILRFLETHLAK